MAHPKELSGGGLSISAFIRKAEEICKILLILSDFVLYNESIHSFP
jgi:hypothetical protein